MPFGRVTRLHKSASFRFACLYTVLFGASVAVLAGFLWQTTIGALSLQLDETVRAEIKGVLDEYRQNGAQGVAILIADRARSDPDGRAIYLLTDAFGRPIVGNIDAWPASITELSRPSDAGEKWLEFQIVGNRSSIVRGQAFVLFGRLRLLVGRDVRELQRYRTTIVNAIIWGIGITLALALVGGVAMSRSSLRRIETINRTSREIMRGDLSRRIPLRGNGDEFDQLAASLNEMLERIQALLEGLRHVSDNIAHDLRTPLSRLRSRLERLDEAGLAESDIRQRVGEALSEADDILALFNALLRITHIEADVRRDEFVPVDLTAIIQDVAELYEPVALEKGLVFVTGDLKGKTLSGDRDLLFQATANLVDNAIKYTASPGSVGIAASGGEIVVWDTGPGVPEDMRATVFERLHRLERDRGEPGSGLGLTLVRAVLQLHEGRVELADNAPGLRVTMKLG